MTMPANDPSSNLMRSEAHLAADNVRQQRAELLKDVGSPISLTGKALAFVVRGSDAWIGESSAVIRKLDLETGKTTRIFKGHTGPVTSIAFCDKIPKSGDGKLLISGSWDQTIKVWDIESKSLISSTDAHTDFVKSLFVLPSLGLLVSGGSDKVVRIWDLSTITPGVPLRVAASINSHTRPVECLEGKPLSDSTALLYTADTMGVIKAWELRKGGGDDTSPEWKYTMLSDLCHHRTRINEMIYMHGQLWTASADETVQVHSEVQPPKDRIWSIKPLQHSLSVRTIVPLSLTDLNEPYLLTGSGNDINIYDVSPADAELVHVISGHWHEVTALRLWERVTSRNGRSALEPWIVSTGLDETIRKWKLTELLDGTTARQVAEALKPKPVKPIDGFELTEDEERELAELMGEDINIP